MDKMTTVIIAFISMIYGTVLLILAEKIDTLHDYFNTKNKEDQDGQR